METLKDKTTRGLFWGGMNNIVQQGLGLLFGIILGRKLFPHDYGMVAMISVFALIATALQESGFRNAIANLKEPQHRDYNAVFWFNIIVGLLCYVVLFFAAPLIAHYYRIPELVPLCRFSFLSIIFASFGSAQTAYLFRQMKVKEQAQCNMTATVLSGIVGISMAFAGFSYWSLASQTLTYIGMNTLLLWHFSDWRPTFEFDFGPVRRMFRFSSKLLATTILDRLNINVMNILLGRHFSTISVGDYNQAYQWNTKVAYLMQGTLSQIAQPVFTNVADEQERQLRILRKLVRFTAFLSFPLLLGFGLVSHEFIVLAIGEKWLRSADLLQLLCISGGFIPFSTVFVNLIISKGKSATYFWVTLALCVTLITAMLLLYPYGIRNMVIAYVCIYIVWTFVWHFFVRRLTGYRLFHLLCDIVPFFLIAAAVMALTGLITHTITSLPLLFVSRIILAALLYYVVMRLLRVKILDECVTFIKTKLF
jgi:O-antigen/teichoic acid export membrane protein